MHVSLVQVFYIDHDHCLTSFIDPRLPLPDTPFIYTTPTITTSTNHRTQQELQFGEEVYTDYMFSLCNYNCRYLFDLWVCL